MRCWLLHQKHRHIRGSSTYYPHLYCDKCMAMRDFWKGLRISLRNGILVDLLGYRYLGDGVTMHRPRPLPSWKDRWRKLRTRQTF